MSVLYCFYEPQIKSLNSMQSEMMSHFDPVPMNASDDEQYRRQFLKFQLGYILKMDAAERAERKRDRDVKELRRRLPQVLTIGVAKCGTHALNFFLQLNPFLATSHLETNFYVFLERYRQGYNWYRQRMKPSYPNQTTMDQGTFYAQVPGILPRVDAVNENMKFILVMCDPVTRDISHFSHGQLFHERRLNATFEETIFSQFKRVITSRLYYDYGRLIQSWLPYVEEGRLHVVDGMRLKTDPVSELNLVEDFIGVPRIITDKLVVFSKPKGFFCKYRDGKEQCMTTNKRRKHPDVATWATAALREWYKPQIKTFSKLTGVRFDWMSEYMKDNV